LQKMLTTDGSVRGRAVELVDTRKLLDADISAILKAASEESGLGWSLAMPPTLPDHVRVDETSVLQVVTNLVSNAVKHGFEENGYVRVTSKVKDNAVLILHVEDCGPGVPIELRKAIFRPYERYAPRPVGGVGMGLNDVHEIMQASGGSVTCSDRPDGHLGARFTVRFPVTVKNGPLPQERATPLEGLSPSNPRSDESYSIVPPHHEEIVKLRGQTMQGTIAVLVAVVALKLSHATYFGEAEMVKWFLFLLILLGMRKTLSLREHGVFASAITAVVAMLSFASMFARTVYYGDCTPPMLVDIHVVFVSAFLGARWAVVWAAVMACSVLLVFFHRSNGLCSGSTPLPHEHSIDLTLGLLASTYLLQFSIVGFARKCVVASREYLSFLSHNIRTPIHAMMSASEALISHCEDKVVVQLGNEVFVSGKFIVTATDVVLGKAHGKLSVPMARVELESVAEQTRQFVKTIFPRHHDKNVEILGEGCQIVVPDTLLTFFISLLLCELAQNIPGPGYAVRASTSVENDEPSKGTQVCLRACVKGVLSSNCLRQGESLRALIHVLYQAGGAFGAEVREDCCTSILRFPCQVLQTRLHTPVPTMERGEIAIVDDNKLNLRILARHLSKEFAVDSIHQFASGAELLEAEKNGQLARVTHVLMDKNMPNMDGVEAATRLLQARAAVKGKIAIAACTADATSACREACLDSGMVDILTKPFGARDLRHLLLRMDDALRSEQIPASSSPAKASSDPTS
jgi:signal transduction histidine kinase/CheY-like chemotaxis protein